MSQYPCPNCVGIATFSNYFHRWQCRRCGWMSKLKYVDGYYWARPLGGWGEWEVIEIQDGRVLVAGSEFDFVISDFFVHPVKLTPPREGGLQDDRTQTN